MLNCWAIDFICSILNEYQPESNKFSLVEPLQMEANQLATHVQHAIAYMLTVDRHMERNIKTTNMRITVSNKRSTFTAKHMYNVHLPQTDHCTHVSISVSQSNQFGHKITVIFCCCFVFVFVMNKNYGFY